MFDTFDEAWECSLREQIERISFDCNGNRERWIPKTETWGGLAEQKMDLLNLFYKRNKDRQIFWVYQKTLPDNWEELRLLPESERLEKWAVSAITNVLTQAEFLRRYSRSHARL
jgi:hypothetical protein